MSPGAAPARRPGETCGTASAPILRLPGTARNGGFVTPKIANLQSVAPDLRRMRGQEYPEPGQGHPGRTAVAVAVALQPGEGSVHPPSARRARARGLALVLEPDKPAAVPSQAGLAPQKDAAALQMHADLNAALKAAPGPRKVCKHLAMVEHKLWHSGLLFLHDLPLGALHRVIEQLDGVIGTLPARGLALLSEEREERERAMRAPPTSFFVDHKRELIEVTPTNFVHAIDESATDVPAHWGS